MLELFAFCVLLGKKKICTIPMNPPNFSPASITDEKVNSEIHLADSQCWFDVHNLPRELYSF